jgi:hypothetical protein
MRVRPAWAASLLAAAAVLVLIVGAALAAITVQARSGEEGGRPTGEVLMDSAVVIVLRTAAGGYTPLRRAEIVADRLDTALRAGLKAADLRTRPVSNGTGLYADSRLIVCAYGPEAEAAGASGHRVLAKTWLRNIVQALGGEASPGTSGRTDYYPNWSTDERKVVPIISVGTPGVRVGAAWVAGPKVQVDKVEAVGQLDLDFQGLAHIRAFVPTTSLNVVKLDRVQGVSVWALADVRLLKL